MKAAPFVILFTTLPLGVFAQAKDVAAPQKRTPTVDLAEQLVAPTKGGNQFYNLINPFTLNGDRSADAPSEADQAAARAAMLASNRSLLTVLAEQLEPKGVFVLGGEPIILLGQKKLKVGEKASITFEGAVYELEITAIETTRFTVRYKNEELTRPIVITKSGK